MTTSRDLSRREFLAASAIGVVGLSAEKAEDDLIYVGTYTEEKRTEGVYLVRMDRRSGKLRQVASVNAGPNPSFLAIHPNGRVLYAANELEKYNGKASGAVSAFAIASDGSLTRRNEQASEGGAPCYVSLDRSGKVVLVANYVGGNVALLPIKVDGSLEPVAQLDQHNGKGPNAERQEAAHAHCIVADPSNHFALAADLGIDRVFIYRLDIDGKSLHHQPSGDAVMKPGAGPRHIAFHPKLPIVLVSNELDSTVAALHFDAQRGALSLLGTHSTVPPGWKGENYPADIHVAPSGRTVYVSNRGHNSIAVFSITGASGALALEQTISTEGDWPRNFSLHPSGPWVLVANQRSNSIVVLARDEKTGRLTSTRERIELPSPVCVRFRAHVGVTT
ncbi:MAG: lactonase family protein [Gemmatimonadaceae bacterium]